MSNFKQYKDLKDKLDIKYNGICLNRVHAVEIYNFVNGSKQNSFIGNIKLILKFCFFSLDTSCFKLLCGSSILSTYGTSKRNDHEELYRNVVKQLGSTVTTHYISTWKYKLQFKPILTCEIFRAVFKALSKSDITYIEKMRISSYFVFYCKIDDSLHKLDFSNVEKYLSMFNVLRIENLITQHMKLRGIPTYSLQEGIYFVHKNDIPIDSIQYENMETDHLLSWGQYSINEFCSYGINPSRFLLAGYPKDVICENLDPNNNFYTCMILLARVSYQESNLKLLNILKEYKNEFKFCIKLHPSCDFVFYKKIADKYNMEIIPLETTISQSLKRGLYDFCIAVNTTVYYESLMRGIPCLRYYDGSFDLMFGYEKDVFETSSDYERTIKNIKGHDIISSAK